MAEAIAMSAANGIPPMPANGTQGNGVASHGQPPAPAFVPSAPTFPAQTAQTAQAQPAAQGFTEEQVQARIAAALADKNPQSQPAPFVPASFAADTQDDPTLASMTGLFTASAALSGLDVDRSIGRAIAAGNLDLIDEAYIKEKGGANAGHLIQIAKSMVQHINTVSTQALNAAHQAAGGAQQWQTVQTVFNSTAPQHLKVVVNKMLDSGNMENIKAATTMIVEHAKSTGSIPQAPGLLSPSQGATVAGSALSKQDFQLAHAKLDKHSPTFARERGELFARRQQGKQLGL